MKFQIIQPVNIEIQFDLYVPDSSDAYFSTLQEFAGANSSWGMQVYFGHTNYGEGNIDGGGALAQEFTFDYDTWMNVKVTVSLDTDWAEFYLNGVFIHGWIWSIYPMGQYQPIRWKRFLCLGWWIFWQPKLLHR